MLLKESNYTNNDNVSYNNGLVIVVITIKCIRVES